MKKWLKRLLIFIGVLAVLAAGAAVYYYICMNPYRGTVDSMPYSKSLDTELSLDEAIEDLDYVYERVSSRHPAWLDGNDAIVNAVEQQYETEKALLSQKGKVTILEIWQACARMTGVMKDGHTGVYYRTEKPKFIESVEEIQLYGLPIRIDDISMETVIDNYLSIYPYERREFALDGFYRRFLNMDYWLAGCGIDITDGVTFTFTTPSGEQDFHYEFVEFEQIKGLENPQDSSEEDLGWVYYNVNKEQDVAVFTLTSCRYNDEYHNTADAFWKEVFDNNIHNVIVDLRGNGGGSSTVANYFMQSLDVDEYRSWGNAMRLGWYLWKQEDVLIENEKREQVFTGKLYVLTDIQTYSSAMDFAMLITDNHLGTIIGEASGNMPDGYGDVLNFELPNSKLAMGVSHKRWWRVDTSKSGQPIMPDYEVDSSIAMEKALELIGSNGK